MSQGISLRKFVVPEVVFGVGALELAGQYLSKYGGRKVLIVTDPGVIQAGWTEKVIDSLRKWDLAYTVFSSLTANPKEHEVMAGVEFYQSHGCDCLLAVGGGSVIDCAKGIGIVCSNRQPILSFEGVDQVRVPMPPLICVPTTGGTSADVSQFAIITDTRAQTKIAIISKAIVPDMALVDPQTLTTMDSYLTACTGLDALVHAIEAFVSNASSSLTDVHALEAIRRIWTALPRTLAQPSDVEARSQVMLGSLEAGMAFSNASLGAVHAMAHSLGGYLDLPHGECNAMLLRHVVDFNFNSSVERFKVMAEIMGIDPRGMTSKALKSAFLATVDQFRRQVGVTDTLGLKGVHGCDIPDLATRAVRDACLVTNPRQACQRDLEVIYEEAL